MKRFWALLPFVAFSGCKNSEPTSISALPAISLTYPASFLLVGEPLQLSVRVVDESGRVVSNPTVEWRSSVPTVATISSTGTLTGATVGETMVTVKYKAVSSSATFTVDPAPCTGQIALNVGEVRQIRGSTALGCMTLAPATAAQDLLLVVGNAAPTQDDTLPFRVALNAGVASTAQSQFGEATVFDPRAIVELQDMEISHALETRLRTYERQVVTRNRERLLSTREREALAPGASLAVTSSLAVVGDRITIRVPNLQSGKNICKDFITTQAVVRAVSDRAVILEDVAQPTGGMSLADYQAIAQEFDNLIYRTDTLWFGSPTDLDNDNRVTIYYTPEVNKLTPAGSGSIVGGFFFGGDLLRRSDYSSNDDCRNQTNEREIFYMLTADPQGTINGNPRSTAGARQVGRGTIAHEFQHMINQSVRQYNPAVKAYETAWLNEALSHFAEEAVGRAARGFSDFQELNATDVNPNPADQVDYIAFFRQNLTRFRLWALRPDTASATSIRARTELSQRGAAWALVRYAADQYSNGNARAFFRKLAAGPEIDISNLLARVGNRPFDEVIGGFLVSVYADGQGIANLATRYSFPSWNMRDAMSSVNGGQYPLLVTPLTSSVISQALSGSGHFFTVHRNSGAAAQTIALQSPGGAALTKSNARVWIARLN